MRFHDRLHRCEGGCNAKHGEDADYPAPREPWRCLKFRCAGCKRWRPWCQGAADDRTELCDDCCAKARAACGDPCADGFCDVCAEAADAAEDARERDRAAEDAERERRAA